MPFEIVSMLAVFNAAANEVLYERIRDELQVQYDIDMMCAKKTKLSILNTKRYYLLGTKSKKKYTNLAHVDFFFQHISMTADNCVVIAEDPTREARNIDLWIFLFRFGFEFQQKAPSRKFFTYNWLYIDWYCFLFCFSMYFFFFSKEQTMCFVRLRKQGNEHMLHFFAENTFRARFSILQSIVNRMFQLQCNHEELMQHLPKLHQRIGTLFIVLENNIVGLVLKDGKTGVKVAGDVLERYAIDNYGWAERSIDKMFEELECRNLTGTKQTRCGLLHALFLWSSSLHVLWQQKISGPTHEIVGSRAKQVVDIFQQRPSSLARLKKSLKTLNSDARRSKKRKLSSWVY